MSAPNQLSFLPDDYLDSKRQRRTNVALAVAFVAVLSGIGTGFATVESALREAEAEHADVARQHGEAARRIEQDRLLQDKQRKMNQQAELAASLLEKVPRSVLLAELTNAMPPGVSLLDVIMESKQRQSGPAGAARGQTQFELKKAAAEGGKPGAKGPAAPVAKVFDVGLKLTGIADNDVQVAQFIAKLNTSKLLRDVNLLISEEHTFNESKMRKFQIELAVDPQAEVQTGPGARRAAAAAVELK